MKGKGARGKPGPISEQECEEFQKAVTEMRPEDVRPRAAPCLPGPGPEGHPRSPSRKKRRTRGPTLPSDPAAFRHKHPDLSDKRFDELCRGDYDVQDQLDLHGEHAEGALQKLQDFLRGCCRREVRQIRIIHGKGRHSPGGAPTLGPLVCDWLKGQALVLAAWTPSRREGGSGALHVFLKKNRSG